MNNNKQKSDVSIWLLLAAASIIVLFFFWYFFIYVNGQEKMLIQKSFRALTQLGENFKNRYDSYCRIIESTDTDSLLSKASSLSSLNKDLKKYSFGMELDTAISIPQDNNNYIYFSNVINNIFKEAKYNDNDSTITDTVCFKISKTDFFQPLERKDIFKEIIVIKHFPNVNEFFYSSLKGELEVSALDSIILLHKGISSGTISDIKISGVDYKLFLTKEKLSNDEIYYIGGIINKDKYVEETRSINSFTLLLILCLFITFLLSIPLFKLKMISENQQLKIPDLLLSTLSIIVGTSFIFLVFLSQLGYLRTKEKVDLTLKELSYSIKSNLIKEINKIDFTLDLFTNNKLLINCTFPSKDSNSIKLDSLTYIKLDTTTYIGLDNLKCIRLNDSLYSINDSSIYLKSNPSYNFKLKKIIFIKSKDTYYNKIDSNSFIRLNNKSYKYFKLIFTLDSLGDQDSIISSRKKVSSPDNYSYRKYFLESGEWHLDSNNLMLDFVISSTSGEQLGVVSERKEDTVYVITSRLTSTINTILPPGYGFCVIDKDGTVKLHSDSKRMLSENFLAETEYSGNLRSAIFGNRKMSFSADYLGKSHTCYIQPIDELPLYIITFFDDAYNNSVNLQVTSTTFIFTFFLIALFLILVVGSRLIDYRKSELKRKFDPVEWLRPTYGKKLLYEKLSIANLLAIVLMIISSLITNFINTIFFIYIFISLQLIIANFYTNYLDHKNLSKKYPRGQPFLSVTIIATIFYLGIKAGANILYLGIMFLLVIIINTVVIKYFYSNNDIKVFNIRFFYFYLLSWLFLIIIVPMIIFYINLYSYEESLDTTHDLYLYAQNEAKRNYAIDKFYNEYTKNTFSVFKEDRKKAGIYRPSSIKRLPDLKIISTTTQNDNDENLGNILFYLKPELDQLSMERKILMKELPDDTLKKIYKSNDTIIINYVIPQLHYSVNKYSRNIYYEGTVLNFGSNKIEVFILTILLSYIIIFLIYKLIKFTSNRIFGLSIQEKQKFNDKIKGFNTSKRNLIIFHSEISDSEIEGLLSVNPESIFEYGKVYAYQLNSLSETSDKIVLKNVKIDFGNPSSEIEKLSVLNNIVQKGHSQLFLIVEQSLERLIEIGKKKLTSEKESISLELINKLILELESLNKIFIHIYLPTGDLKNENAEDYLKEKLHIHNELSIPDFIREMFNQIHVNLTDFRNLRKLLTKKLKSENETEKNIENIPKEVKLIIKKELIALRLPYDSMVRYSEQIIKYASDNIVDKKLNENIILYIQEVATPYYETIWESCNNEEKLLLVDIADNLLLNDKNNKVVEILISKGLLKKNVSIDIMNQSFRNFINLKFDTDQEKEYVTVRKSGNWSKYRAPILLLLFAIAFFIALQQNILSNIYSILTVIVGIATAVGKLSGMFSPDHFFKKPSEEIT